MERSKTIAIVGAGLSGLASLKSALENDMMPTLFEKSDDIGGAWSSSTSGLMWDTLHTNVSKYTCMFSDFMWRPEHLQDANQDYFPSQKDVYRYFLDYTNHFNLKPYIKFNCKVTNIKKQHQQEQQFIIEYEDNNNSNNNKKKTVMFDYVIIASGIFSEGMIPKIEGADSFNGLAMHSADYRNAKPFEGMRVAVVGSSSSGSEIASDLVNSSLVKEVTTFARTNIFIIPKSVKTANRSYKVPFDYVSFSRKRYYEDNRSTPEKNRAKQAFIASVSTQQDIEETKVRSSPELPLFVGLSDDFISLIRSQHIKYINTTINRIEGNKLYYNQPIYNNSNNNNNDNNNSNDDNDIKKEKKETTVEVDAIIYCTGYYVNLEYLDKEILDAIEFDRSHKIQPILAYNTVFPRGVDGLAFVGMYRGPYFGVCELQARWATGVFSGNVKAPTTEEIAAGVELERAIRNDKNQPQFPHSDYVAFSDLIAKSIGVLPDFNELQKQQQHQAEEQKETTTGSSETTKTHLYKMIWDGFFIPPTFRLYGLGSNYKEAVANIEEINNLFTNR
ncbi:hypothetical protein PPL_05416 [Heterostelium album PN500]|uniref:Flavin-containing monooxygenase n=1 Tax=Heterostelium pallidum (strain ATCC 26659 / Pp 5 / PN500) TaxID=670386 RepID=D3BA42_HETP5|nr:hypothetical protein PPL_05416 [Heterostelium album PN500]EFA81429.1 hypothetical protein PPL_05416 [Heterostelium album PN500]|eukprot:XP_020433547.1 hypothetical protein PPL_05416 [Heterostelium album PN500]